MTEQRVGAMKDDERLRGVSLSDVDGNAPGLSLIVDHSHLQMRRLAGSRRRILALPSIELSTQHTIDDGHWSPSLLCHAPYRRRDSLQELTRIRNRQNR